jgi:hypothetical protein
MLLNIGIISIIPFLIVFLVGIFADSIVASKLSKAIDYLIENAYLFFVDYVLVFKSIKEHRNKAGIVLLYILTGIIVWFLISSDFQFNEIHFSYRWFMWYILIVWYLYLSKEIVKAAKRLNKNCK